MNHVDDDDDDEQQTSMYGTHQAHRSVQKTRFVKKHETHSILIKDKGRHRKYPSLPNNFDITKKRKKQPEGKLLLMI